MPPLPQGAALNVPQALAQALALHKQGRIGEAERLYAAILTTRPDHFDALQMMALVKLAKGDPAQALRLVSAAMQQRKPSPQILLNQGMILNALDRRAEALEAFDQAIKQKSKFAEAHNNRGVVLASLGREDEAIEAFRKALAIEPAYVDAHYNYSNALRRLGRLDEALKSLDRALTLKPDYVKAHNNRGAVLEMQGRLEEALAAFERALAIDAGFADARANRGRLLGRLDRFDQALANFEVALAQKPDDAEAHYNQGKILIEINRNDEAAAEFAKALALRPGFAEAAFAACLAELPIAYGDEAEIARRRAAYDAKLKVLSDDVAGGRLTGDLLKAVTGRQPFLLAYQGGNDRDLQQRYGEMVAGIMARAFPPAPLAAPPAPGEPIRVGIVSSFFYQHSNWKIPIKGWLSQLDRSRFKLYGYHLGLQRDAETEAAVGMCERFVQRALELDGWRREILADAPHVLIYPGLLMDALSLPLAAQRLAPVQCNSWGHPETSGLATIDYFLSSDLMEPADAETQYTERLVRLPNLSVYYEPAEAEPVALTREALGLRANAPLFWCGQSLYKYLPQYDGVFARIAKQTPGCQFAFLRHGSAAEVTELFQARLEHAFAAEGLRAADHCVFLPRMSQSQFIAATGLCDVFLDSIGWSGCNSLLESLPHNIPVVTLPGATMRARHAAAILTMMGVSDTIARDRDDYVAIAARLAGNADERRGLAARIAENKTKLFRDRACIAALQDLLESAVRGQPA